MSSNSATLNLSLVGYGSDSYYQAGTATAKGLIVTLFCRIASFANVLALLSLLMLFDDFSRPSTFYHVSVLVRASIKVYLVRVRLCIKSANKRSRPGHTQPTKIGVSPRAARSETAVCTGSVNPCCVVACHCLQ